MKNFYIACRQTESDLRRLLRAVRLSRSSRSLMAESLSIFKNLTGVPFATRKMLLDASEWPATTRAGGFDSTLLGPAGSPHVSDYITLWGLLLPIHQGLEQYINLRPLHTKIDF
jgi:isocitrate/isopropylmalate dehydrogenase